MLLCQGSVLQRGGVDVACAACQFIGCTHPHAATSGVAGADGRKARMVSLADEARRFLAQRAAHADLAARPQPYQVPGRAPSCPAGMGLMHDSCWPPRQSCCMAIAPSSCPPPE